MATPHFTPALFKFLRELAKNNEREWFQANKARYEKDVRDPMLAFIAALAPKLGKLSPHFKVDARPVGGSLFRIHRDVRFAADKSPYKTHVAAHFSHLRGEGPGFYVSLEPKESYGGAGLWRPEPGPLAHVRTALMAAPAEWKKAVKGIELDGESLKRPPRGIDPDHALIEDLKRKDFVSGEPFTEAQVLAPDFLERYVAACKARAPLVRFLCRALDLPF